MYEKTHLHTKAADDAKMQFHDLINIIVVQHHEQYLSSDYSMQRLDHFFAMKQEIQRCMLYYDNVIHTVTWTK